MAGTSGIGHLLNALGVPVEEITGAAQKLIVIAQEIKAQLDRIENRLANLEASFVGPTSRGTDLIPIRRINGPDASGAANPTARETN
jgi:hypothetical protein